MVRDNAAIALHVDTRPILLPQRPGFVLRLYRMVRKLIRTRRESTLVRAATARARFAETRLEGVIDDRDKQVAALNDALHGKNREIAILREQEIPRLERQIEVLKASNELLTHLHQRTLDHVKADIAVENMRAGAGGVQLPFIRT